MKVNAPHEAANDDTTLAQTLAYWAGLMSFGAFPLAGGFAAVSAGFDPILSGMAAALFVLPCLFAGLYLLDDYAPPIYHK